MSWIRRGLAGLVGLLINILIGVLMGLSGWAASVSMADSKNQDHEFFGRLQPTIYFQPLIFDEVDSCSTGKWRSLKNRKGLELMRVCSNTYNQCAIEGSCRVSRQAVVRSFNFQDYVGGQHLFFEITGGGCVFGYGVSHSCLDPFYSVAADLRYHRAGSVIYVPDAVGLVLPGGRRHDGYFVVRDTGGAIKGSLRFDFFSGSLDWDDPRNPFFQAGFNDPKLRHDMYRVKGETAKRILSERAYPGLPSPVESFLSPDLE